MNTARTNHNTLHNQESGPVAGPVSNSELTLLERLHIALGPLAAGIIIDIVDFAAFGPLSVLIGPDASAALAVLRHGTGAPRA